MDTVNTHRLQVLCLVVTLGICLCRTGVSAAAPAQQQEEFKSDGDSVVMCSKGACERRSQENIKAAYPDSFSSQKDAEKTTGLKYYTYVETFPAQCSSCQNIFWSDKDTCCPTWRYVTFYKGHFRDITNRWCYIIQIPFLRLYQYMSVGLCGPRYRCRKCVQQYTTQSLLAWCPGSSGINMHHFRIPTYCSCQ